MGLLDRFRTPTTGAAVALAEADSPDLTQAEATIELFQERLAELELQLEDWNWVRLAAEGDREFTRTGLDRIIALSRLMAIKNPLIGRSIRVGNYYLWGQGVEVNADDDTVNDIVHRFIDDRGNQRAVFGHEARKLLEQTLRTDGNLFFHLTPSRITGDVAVRTIPVDEIRDIISNPNDRSEPWFYLRSWNEVRLDETTGLSEVVRRRDAYYPDWTYQPRFRRPTIAGQPVMWDTPVYHVRVGGLQAMRFGVPQTYSANDWARAYNQFLEQVASMASSLSRFAFKVTSGRGKAADTARRLNTTVAPSSPAGETNPSPVTGAAFVGSENVTLEAVNKAGALIAGSEGKEFRLMVAAATDLPDTILSGDPDQGNLATAKTLDRPTELAFIDRQTLWSTIYQDLCDIAVDWAVLAPGGLLQGLAVRTGPTTVKVELPDETDRTVTVTFPPILEVDVKDRTDSIVEADATGLVPKRTIARLLLATLGVEDIDEVLDEMDAEGLFDMQPGLNAGDALIQRFRAGQDPAASYRGVPAPPALPAPGTPPPDPAGQVR